MLPPNPMVQAGWLRAIAAGITPPPGPPVPMRCQLCGRPSAQAECDDCWAEAERAFERRMDQ